MKKEVIYFSAFSMMEPDTVELLKDNRGQVISPNKKKTIDLPEHKILTFWDKIEEIGVWNWSKKYPVKEPELIQMTDGYSWTLKLRNRNGKANHCTGYMSFPRKFKDLIKELNSLFGSNIRF